MTLSIGENIIESFEFAKDGLVGYWLRWIILTVITCIPIVNFIAYGYMVKIYKGGHVAPELEDYLDMFIDGIKLVIIGLVYVIIPCIVIFAANFFSGVVQALLALIGFILLLVCILVGMMACIRFAKEDSLVEAFNFGELLETIGDIGWGHYILSLIACYIVLVFITFLALLSLLIPYIGWLLSLIPMPLLMMFSAKFLENLYSGA